MNTATPLLTSMLPLYILVLLGYIASKKLAIDSKPIAVLAVYLLAPLIIFNSCIYFSGQFARIVHYRYFWSKRLAKKFNRFAGVCRYVLSEGVEYVPLATHVVEDA